MTPPFSTVPLLLLALSLGTSCAAPAAQVQSPEEERDPFARKFRQLDFGVGIRSFDDNDWNPNDDITSFALYYQERDQLGPFALEGGLHYAFSNDREDGRNLDVDLFEFSAGVRRDFDLESIGMIPFVGFGAALIWADVDTYDGTDFDSDEDVVFGGYVKGGLLFPVSDGGHIGFEVRRIEAGDLSFGGKNFDASATEGLIIFGARF